MSKPTTSPSYGEVSDSDDVADLRYECIRGSGINPGVGVSSEEVSPTK